MSIRENFWKNVDWLTVFLFLFLVLYGWLSIYSASGSNESSSIFDFSQRYGKQLLWIAMALFLAFSILLIDAKFFSSFAYVFYFLIMLTLIGVLLFGKTVAGSRSWFQIGSFAIQPAEFAKFATALALAKYLSKTQSDMRLFKSRIVTAAIIGFPALLILMQNDTGSALVYMAFILVLYREGLSGWILVVGLVLGVLFTITIKFGEIYVAIGLVALAVLVFGLFRGFRRQWKIWLTGLLFSLIFVSMVDYAFQHVLESHQRVRIQVMLGMKEDPHGAGYNVNQAKIAIGSGGLTGKGYLKGMLTRNHFVPEQSTDFIFCTVGEERGFLGSSVLILLFLGLLIRIIMLAERQRSPFGRIYGYGVASILFFHFTINLAMTIGLFPVVGIPLPFFSYGGSSLWAFTILLFIFIKQDANRMNVLY
ncbi:Rod shape-determining protein RodA [hydrothermal vent metagenome]|uniref:Rod shape-determining protein RodA n=1 Tax=hydrothermal vent metagenome TaxID=652676 RepID=A0A3B0UWR3_9ZZZZ